MSTKKAINSTSTGTYAQVDADTDTDQETDHDTDHDTLEDDGAVRTPLSQDITMALLATGVDVTLDESDDLQNAQDAGGTLQDADDNDIAAAVLPGAFASRLNDLWGGHTPINAALSGYNGSNSGENILNLQSAGGTVGMAFSDAQGQALDGDASGLKTTAGADIFLWTDSVDGQLVLGRQGVWAGDHYVADASGDIVFAGYLEQTGTPVSGARMWTVQYQSLNHPDAQSPDEPVDLSQHLWVTVSQAQEFSLAGIPSGQNLFLMVGNSQSAIVITGQHPANQSLGEKVTDGDTVNTSQANGGSIATNNQLISPPSGQQPGEGMYITFVTGANPNYTAPNLDENEADVEANIAFTGLYEQSAASIRISQVTPNTSATLKVSAWNTALETGNGFVDGLGDQDDVAVAITAVHVYTMVDGVHVEVTDPDLHIIDNGDGTWNVQGVKANEVIAYDTASGHTRVLVENVGSTEARYNASFDIGGFEFTEGQTLTEDIGAHVRFEDDGPSVDPSLQSIPTLTVDDSDYSVNDAAVMASLFAVSFHNDGFKDSDHDGIQDADALTYTLGVSAPDADSGLLDTLSGDAVLLNKVGNVVVGTANGLEAFRITVNSATGEVSLDQSRAVMHNDPSDPDEAGLSAARLASAALVTLTATATDGDLDTDSSTREIGEAFLFKDDGPTFDYITNLIGFNVQFPLVGFDRITQGNDTAGVFMSSLTGRVDGHDITNTQVTLKEETGGQVYYTFSFDYLPGPGSTLPETATGIVTVNKAEGTFFFDIDQPIKGETSYSTSAPQATFNYDRLGNKSPEIVVQQYDEHFYGVLTARSAQPPSDTQDLLAGGNYAFTPGEVFDSVSEAYLNIATSTVGANSDTMQAGELLNLDFYAVNPVLGTTSPPQNPAANVDSSAERALASEVRITLSQINVGQEDIAVLLKLYNPDTDTSTTRLLLANAATDYVLDPATGYRIVTIGKDDYDSAHQQISGVQVMSSTEDITGTGYALSTHEAVSLTAAGRDLADSSDNDVFKIIQIDIRTEQTATFDTDLVFTGQVVDLDLDAQPFTFKVHLEADSKILSAPGSLDALNGTPEADIFQVVKGTSSLDLRDAQYILGYTNNFQTGLDMLKLGLAGDATTATGNYVEASAGVSDYAAALAAANLALAALNASSSHSQLYAFEFDSENGYVFEDTDSDGAADQVVVLVGIQQDGLSAADIIA